MLSCVVIIMLSELSRSTVKHAAPDMYICVYIGMSFPSEFQQVYEHHSLSDTAIPWLCDRSHFMYEKWTFCSLQWKVTYQWRI